MADRTFLSWPFFDDSHRAFAEALDVWAADEIAPHFGAETEVEALTRRLVSLLGSGGWLRHVVPASHGGAAATLDVRTLCLAREILAYHCGLADFAFAMQGLGTGSISLFGGNELKAAYLPPVAAGQRIAAFALSEPEAGSDVAALATTARAEGNHYIIDGQKTWISNAGIADHYVLFARTGEGPGAKGLSAFVVDDGIPGLTIGEKIPVTAPHPLGTIAFEGCRVPAAQMLGAPGEGFKVAMATLDIFRATVGAAALGFARRALDEAVRRARERQIFGQALAEFQMTQHKIADMAVATDAAALLVYRAAWTKDARGVRVTRESSMAKLHATEAAQRVIDETVQIFGGHGVVVGGVPEQLYRDIRALRIYEGTSEIQRLVIAGQVIKAVAEG